MKKIELILGALAAIALLMNFNLITGGALLGILAIMLLACLYWPGGFPLLNNIPLRNLFRKDTYKGMSSIRIIGSALAGMAFSLVCVGVLFKVQHWSGADMNLKTGLISTASVFVVSLIKFSSTKAELYRNTIVRSIIYGIVGIAALSVSVEDLERFTYRNHPKYLEVYEQHLADPKNERLWKELEIEHHRATFSPEMFEIYMEHEGL